jgi:xanthine dehydrogenase YagR molybdenum-binding subunit
MHGFGAQFAEVRVNEDTGKVRVPRLLGVFAAGRIVNAKTARSQFLGGMTWGSQWRCTRRVCWIRTSATK